MDGLTVVPHVGFHSLVLSAAKESFDHISAYFKKCLDVFNVYFMHYEGK